MNEKNKAIAVLLLAVGSLSGLYIFIGVQFHNNTINYLIEKEKEETDLVISSRESYSLDPYKKRIENFLQSSEPIIEAFSRRDRKLLHERAAVKYEALQKENDYFREMMFVLPDGTCFLRMHDPANFGDSLLETRPMLKAACRNRKQVAGYETGFYQAAYRIAQPVYLRGEFLGVLEFAIDISMIKEALERKIGSGVAVYLLAQEKRKVTRADKFDSWLTRAGFIALGSANLLKEIPSDFDFSRDGKSVSISGKTYIAHIHPEFADYAGTPIGGIIVFQDITPHVFRKKVFVVKALIITGFFLIISLVVLYSAFGALIGKLEKSRRDLSDTVERLTQEIAARNQVQEKLQHVQKSWVKTFDAISDIITIQDADMRIVHSNRAGCELFNMTAPEQMAGKLCYELFCDGNVPCDGCPIPHARRYLEPYTAEISHAHLKKTFLVSATPILDDEGKLEEVVHFAKDISAFKKMEKQLHQAQKMESIGRLAGGVAHDFNNILSAIIGYAELALVRMKEGRRVDDEIKIILEAGKRATRLIRQLMAFSRKQVNDPVLLDLNNEIKETWKMLQRLLGEHIESVFSAGENLWPVLADRSQVEQIIVNLAVNARDAMPGGGKLLLRTENCSLRGKMTYGEGELPPGDYVKLCVTDNGQGMTDEVREHIFEPFFSTKGDNRGTGLGLATVYGIVKQSNGAIFVETEPGEVSFFEIFLPRAKTAPDSERAGEMEIEELCCRGGETILLVEDNEMVRSMCFEALTALGYLVVQAANGKDALEVCEKYEGEIHLLLTDIVLPVMNGVDLAEKVVAMRPFVKVLYMSGHIENDLVRKSVARPGIHYMQKPISPVSLSRFVRRVLG